MILDRLLHRVPWDGDRIRLYRADANPGKIFIGEYRLKIQSGEVFVTGSGYIRRDLPKWSNRFGCWEYFYSAGGGE